MLNPNCEYGANFVPIHTLAQWSKCTVDGTMPNQNDSVISGELLKRIVKRNTKMLLNIYLGHDQVVNVLSF